MKQPLKLLLAILVLLGCRNPRPTLDPFSIYGPTRVPPPTTGSIVQPDPYYRPPTSTAAPPPVNIGPPPPTNLQAPPTGLLPRTSGGRDQTNATRFSQRWQPTDVEDTSAPPSPGTGRADFGKNASVEGLQEGTDLRWTQPNVVSENRMRQASAQRSILAFPTRASEAPDARVTRQNGGQGQRILQNAHGQPRPFQPQGRLFEITELPGPGYTPGTFDPSARHAFPTAATLGTGTSQVVSTGTVPYIGPCDCEPGHPAVASSVPILPIPQSPRSAVRFASHHERPSEGTVENSGQESPPEKLRWQSRSKF